MYLGKYFFAYVETAFPLCLLFLLRSSHKPFNASWLHSASYWIVAALWFYFFWHLINWDEGPRSLFENHPYLRKFIAAGLFPLAGFLSGPGHYWLVEGRLPPLGVFWFLFGLALVLLGVGTYVCTGQIPIAKRGQDEADEAGRAFKPILALIMVIVGAAVGLLQYAGLLIPYLSDIGGDGNLIAASILLSLCFLATILQPLLIKGEIEHRLKKRTKKEPPQTVQGG